MNDYKKEIARLQQSCSKLIEYKNEANELIASINALVYRLKRAPTEPVHKAQRFIVWLYRGKVTKVDSIPASVVKAARCERCAEPKATK